MSGGVISVPLHIGDFLSGTMHMDTLETGAYLRLILAHYQNGVEGLPNCDKKLARIAGVSKRVWDRIKDTLEEKFEVSQERWVSVKCVEVIEGIKAKSEKQRKNIRKRFPKVDKDANFSGRISDTNETPKCLKNKEPPNTTVLPPINQPKPKPKPYRTDDDDAGAKKPKSEHVVIGERIAQRTGWVDNPNWFGSYAMISAWLSRGYDPDLDILPAVDLVMRKLEAKERPPPNNLAYFEPEIIKHHTTRTAPAPLVKSEGLIHHAAPINNRRKSRTEEIDDYVMQELEALGQC